PLPPASPCRSRRRTASPHWRGWPHRAAPRARRSWAMSASHISWLPRRSDGLCVGADRHRITIEQLEGRTPAEIVSIALLDADEWPLHELHARAIALGRKIHLDQHFDAVALIDVGEA